MTAPHKRSAPRKAAVRRVMRKHGLPEPQARLVASLAFSGGRDG